MQTQVWGDVRVIAWVNNIIFFDFRPKVGDDIDKWSEDTVFGKDSLKGFLRDAETSPGELLWNKTLGQCQFAWRLQSFTGDVLNKILGGVFTDLEIISDITQSTADSHLSLNYLQLAAESVLLYFRLCKYEHLGP